MAEVVERRRHPVRGALWGLLFGVGIAVELIVFNVIAFGTLVPYIVVAATVLAGILWGSFGPSKRSEVATIAAPPPPPATET